MEIVVLASALKRDITEGDIRHALANPIASTDMDDSCHMVVGADLAGRLIEVGIRIVEEQNTIFAFHSLRPPDRSFFPER